MLQANISRSLENPIDPRLGKKVSKQRSKALSDVKNTIHSHSSNLIQKDKNVKKRIKKDAGLISVGKSKQNFEAKNGFSILETETGNDVENCNSEFECQNHFACEQANSLNETEFLGEYKLSKKEINFFGDRMNFFRMDSVPVKINTLEPVEDVEIGEIRSRWFDDETEEVIMNLEIPEPSFL